MNREQYLYLKLAEECKEIAFLCDKIMQFGIDDKKDEYTESNRIRLNEELNDLYAIVQMLDNEKYFEAVIDKIKIINKINKVNKYYKLSQTLGYVKL